MRTRSRTVSFAAVGLLLLACGGETDDAPKPGPLETGVYKVTMRSSSCPLEANEAFVKRCVRSDGVARLYLPFPTFFVNDTPSLSFFGTLEIEETKDGMSYDRTDDPACAGGEHKLATTLSERSSEGITIFAREEAVGCPAPVGTKTCEATYRLDHLRACEANGFASVSMPGGLGGMSFNCACE